MCFSNLRGISSFEASWAGLDDDCKTRAIGLEGRSEHRGKQGHPTQFPLKPKHEVELQSLRAGKPPNRGDRRGGVGHVSQRMVINGHRVERKITSHDLLGAVV